jgi:uncharacterized protein (TIGR00730 family)
MKRICVFCGANAGNSPRYAEVARELGGELAARGIELVYGGGHVGLMGAVADGTLAAGGRVIGVIPRALLERELAHKGAQEMHVVETMHERKALMAKLSDAFVALPGGYGTLDELCEVLTWSQLGIHRKPVAMFDVDDYWAPLVALFDHAVSRGFVSAENRRLVLQESSLQRLMDRLASWRAFGGETWLGERDL